jgi:hypothetical protein
VAQGREIDAIKLLTSMGMNLTDAKQRADEIEKHAGDLSSLIQVI